MSRQGPFAFLEFKPPFFSSDEILHKSQTPGLCGHPPVIPQPAVIVFHMSPPRQVPPLRNSPLMAVLGAPFFFSFEVEKSPLLHLTALTHPRPSLFPPEDHHPPTPPSVLLQAPHPPHAPALPFFHIPMAPPPFLFDSPPMMKKDFFAFFFKGSLPASFPVLPIEQSIFFFF